jgi:predicted nucleic acid-binding protein
MIILDTNVISALVKQVPQLPLLAWLDRQPRTSLWTTAVNLMELRYGIQIMPEGRRKREITKSFELMIQAKLEGRVADFDSAAARRTAELMAERHAKGRPIDLSGSMIAGIVLSRNAVLATRNVAHFLDLGDRVVNPWE